MKLNGTTLGMVLASFLALSAGVTHTRVWGEAVFAAKSTERFQASSMAAGSAESAVPVHIKHEYTPYEQLVLKSASQFHKNFNARMFEKNGDLVADDLHVNSNGTELHGRDAFVSRIGRFVEPFPDVKIDDQIIIVTETRRQSVL